MNYETATEQQLEDRLADLVGFEPSDMDKLACAMVKGLKADGICDPNEKDTASPNYCTDWNATMPLAVERKISIIPSINENFYRAIPVTGEIIHDTSPLRAIVICLIKVLESQQ